MNHDLDRVERLYGRAAVARLAESTVLVAGLGAVGSFACEALARTGVGHLILVDFDVVHSSNLNRQLFATAPNIGRPKVECACERLSEIAPGIRLTPRPVFIDESSAGELLKGTQVLVDAIDSVGPKASLLAAAVHAGLSVFSSMGAAMRTDPTAIQVGDLFQTRDCPLARFMRKRLRRRGIHSGIRCVYSSEPPRSAPEDGPEESLDADRLVDRGLPRKVLGSTCALPGIFGLTLAQEVVNQLLDSSD